MGHNDVAWPGVRVVPVDQIGYTLQSEPEFDLETASHAGNPLINIMNKLRDGTVDLENDPFLLADADILDGQLVTLDNELLFCLKQFQQKSGQKVQLRLKAVRLPEDVKHRLRGWAAHTSRSLPNRANFISSAPVGSSMRGHADGGHGSRARPPPRGWHPSTAQQPSKQVAEGGQEAWEDLGVDLEAAPAYDTYDPEEVVP